MKTNMNKLMKKVSVAVISAVAAAFTVFAEPASITVDSVQQRYPWNNKVDVSYTLENITVGHAYDISFKLINAATTLTNEVKAVTKLASTEATYTGTYTIDIPTQAADFDGIFNTNDVAVVGALADSALDLDENAGVTYQKGDYLIVSLVNGTSDYNGKEYKAGEIEVLTNVDNPVEVLKTIEKAKKIDTLDEFRLNRMVFRKIPAGAFMEAKGDSSKGTRTVISNDLYIAVFECTQTQYKNLKGSVPSGQAYPNGYRRPVGTLSRNMITENDGVIDKMNALIAGKGYTAKLPTVAEYERALRAGTTSMYFWGTSTYSSTVGKYVYYDSSSTQPARVGDKTPNAWGIYDINGNAREWCSDPYPDTKYAATHGCLCGGSWVGKVDKNFYAGYVYGEEVTEKTTYNGFRFVLVPATTETTVKDAAGNDVTVKVEESWLTNQCITAEQLGDEAANGCTYLENYVLGLDPTNALSRPVVAPVQTTNATTLTMNVVGLNPPLNSGMNIKFELNEGIDTAHYAPVATNDMPTIEADLPTEGVKYFKVRTLMYGN